MADYYIKSVCYGGGSSIKEVKTSNALQSEPGTRRTRAEVVKDIDTYNKAVYTATKRSGVWYEGSRVNTVTVSGVKYLRTDRNSTARDNLGELPEYTDC